MKKLLLITAVCFPLICSGQGIRQSFTNKSTRLVTEAPSVKNSRGINGSKSAGSPQKDYALYRNNVRQYTSLEGQGEPITQEVANHLPFISSGQGIRQSLSSGQGIRQSFTNKSTRLVLEAPSAKNSRGINEGKSAGSPQKDYVLYRNIVRQYTWLVGQGEPITQEVANHLPFYYRLSMKNEKGHWQHIEAMHGDTLTTHHNQDPYFINRNYDGEIADKDWFVKVSSIAQWFITCNLTGDVVVEERAYTKNGDMVYGFIPIRNDEKHITGSYIDAYGYPVDMNEDEEFTYGSVVYITYDEQGGDYIVDYLDGEGYRKPNSNGVDQERTLYDDRMRPVRCTSHNCIGDYMKDNWGNCGILYEYASDSQSYTITIVDETLKPMRLPEFRADDTQTYIRCKVLLDEWGREIEKIMLTEDNRPDATLSGIHRIVYQYAENGIIASRTFYDINGNEIK